MSAEFVAVDLSTGGQCLVDVDDLGLITGPTWHAQRDGHSTYAVTTVRGVRLRMHRLLLGVSDPSIQVDHVNGDGLDNRRVNIRLASCSQNQANRHRLGRGSSSFRGVTWHRQLGRWQAGIKVEGRSFHLGLWAEEADAAKAYDVAAREFFGEFARCNFDGEAGA